MSNAIFGKTMENLRNIIDIKLVNNEKAYLKCTSKPSYMWRKIFDNSFFAIRKSKVSLKLNKPANIGMCILELSKVLMYEFYYDYIKKNMTTNQNYYSQTLTIVIATNVLSVNMTIKEALI